MLRLSLSIIRESFKSLVLINKISQLNTFPEFFDRQNELCLHTLMFYSILNTKTLKFVIGTLTPSIIPTVEHWSSENVLA